MRVSIQLAAIISLTFACDAFAYIDPNAGSMVLQLLLGGLAGLSLFGRLLWRRLTSRRSASSDAPHDGAA